jgi:ribose transport system ATP-binding protein
MSGPVAAQADLPDALDARGVSKTFDGNRVLHNLAMRIPAGAVHALLGHNGSGKSTFIKVLAGYYDADPGSAPVRVGGTLLHFGNPDSARRAGVTFVHQSLGLIGSMSVLDNLRMGRQFRTGALGRIRWRQERQAAEAELARFGLDIDPLAPVELLSAIERTSVAIARAVGQEGEDIRLLVLDEPTATMNDSDVGRLFQTIRLVQQHGVGVLYVSHRLEEVPQIASNVTVLRDGETVGQGAVAEFSVERLVGLISGEAGKSGRADTGGSGTGPRAPSQADAAPVRLRLSGVAAGALKGLDLEGRSGEMLGIVGLIGSGIDDLARVLSGQLAITVGQVNYEGRALDVSRTHEVLRRGITVVVAERAHRVILDLSLRENLSLCALRSFFRRAWLERGAESRFVRSLIQDFNIRPPDPEAGVRTLSGGNQQKAAIARAIRSAPGVLVLEEPTQGVDAAGRAEIQGFLVAAAAAGALVLLIDSDLEEVAAISTRVVVLRDGRAAREFAGADIDRAIIMQACYGVQSSSAVGK